MNDASEFTPSTLKEGDSEAADAGVVVVRRYGLLDLIDWDDDVTEELWRANRFWNTLVEIERANRMGCTGYPTCDYISWADSGGASRDVKRI